jgi:hypothetical protein
MLVSVAEEEWLLGEPPGVPHSIITLTRLTPTSMMLRLLTLSSVTDLLQ